MSGLFRTMCTNNADYLSYGNWGKQGKQERVANCVVIGLSSYRLFQIGRLFGIPRFFDKILARKRATNTIETDFRGALGEKQGPLASK